MQNSRAVSVVNFNFGKELCRIPGRELTWQFLRSGAMLSREAGEHVYRLPRIFYSIVVSSACASSDRLVGGGGIRSTLDEAGCVVLLCWAGTGFLITGF